MSRKMKNLLAEKAAKQTAIITFIFYPPVLTFPISFTLIMFPFM